MSIDLLAEVREVVLKSNSVVVSSVKEHFIQLQLEEYKKNLIEVFKKLMKMKDDLGKIRPDNVTYVDGKKNEVFTEKKWKEKEKLEKDIEEIKKVLDDVMSGKDVWDKVKKLAGGGKAENDKPTEQV